MALLAPVDAVDAAEPSLDVGREFDIPLVARGLTPGLPGLIPEASDIVQATHHCQRILIALTVYERKDFFF